MVKQFRSMKKILLTNHFLRDFTGSELAIYDLAREFRDMEYHVSIGTFDYDNPIKSLFKKLDVEILDLNKSLNREFDIIWAHHFTTLDACLLDNDITANKIIFSSMSPYEPLECPPMYIDKITIVLVNSEENKNTLLDMKIPEKKISVFPNPVRREFFIKTKVHQEPFLNYLAIISSHIPDELQEAIPLLKAKGIKVDVFGMNNKFIYITPEILSRYDAVISIGRTVQYSLAMGIPIYCYDRFGGPGYIFEKNKNLAAYYNFSGRCTKIKKSSAMIVSELTTLFKDVLLDQGVLRQYASCKFNLSHHVTDILKVENNLSDSLEIEMFYKIFYRQHKYIKIITQQNNKIINSKSWKIIIKIRVRIQRIYNFFKTILT